ncbi:MAG: NADH-quinone oxidoreductase subunit N [Acidimicrobiia bacterium]|nr:NADH-quinone oxidoreductase subunit N [Acidimicrobiia bacterium]
MIDWHAVAPELVLTGTVLAVLLVDLLVPNRAKWTLGAVSAVGLLLAVVPLLTLAAGDLPRETFAGSYVVDEFALVFKGLFIAAGYIVLLLSIDSIEEGAYYRGEFYFLLLSSIAGMFLISSARDLIVLFIAFELFSAPGYLLAAWRKSSLRSTEAGLKYFILGVLSTAVMLLGMALLYGVAGSTKFDAIAAALPGASAPEVAAWLQGVDVQAVAVLGIVAVIIGFAFKVSAVPFHFWAPDAYEGAPIPVTAFLSVSVKAAGFVGMILLLFGALRFSGEIWRPFIWVLSVLTMTIGNLIALRQTNLVRMLAYSSIAQSGYILAPLSVVGLGAEVSQQALQAAVLYLLVYAVMNLGAFGVVIAAARRTNTVDLGSYNGLYRTMPALAAMMTLFMASLTGIPPLAGWLGKFQVFSALASADEPAAWTLVVVAVVNSVIAAVYYMGVVRRMYFEEPDPRYHAALLTGGETAPPAPLALALGLLSFGVVLLGITDILPYFSRVAELAL